MNVFEIVENLFRDYGYFVLLIGLPLDFIALPIPPGNSTLTFAGYLSYKGVLNGATAFSVALIGALIGVTITYYMGYKLGMPLIDRYGKWLALKPSLIQKTRRYYDKYGNRLLFICFFIPGVRQFIGYFIGIIRVPYRTVVIYAYSGVLLWVGVFWAIGFLFGNQWQRVFRLFENYINYLLIGVAGLFVLYVLIRLFRRLIRQLEI